MPKKRKFFAGAPPEKGKRMQRTEAVADTDLTFIRLVKERRYQEALAVIGQVRDINVADPETGATALHFAAHRSCLQLFEALAQRNDLNYLVQDSEGRYPSELAWEVSGNETLGAELMQREKAQADREGEEPWPKPPPFKAQPR